MKQKQKFRILIYGTIMRRDIGAAYVLARLLEHMGCECYIAGNNTCYSRSTRLWNPHGAVTVTMNRLAHLRKMYPAARLFYYSGEGGESYRFCNERPIASDEEMFEETERFYLWGDFTRQHIARRVEELGEDSFLYNRKERMDEKCMVVGHPRLDIIRYCSPKPRSDTRIRVGLVGHFNMMNNIAGRSPLCAVFNGSNDEEMLFQANLLSSYIRIIHALDPNRYDISIRPYPLESISQYENSQMVREGKVKLDRLLEFGCWAVEQDLIIGPTSSTLSQIAIAQRPFINLDGLNNRGLAGYKDSIRKTFIELIPNHCPQNHEELFTMIENYHQLSLTNPAFDEMMSSVYSSYKKGSCLWTVAKDIVQTLRANPLQVNSAIPTGAMHFLHKMRYKKNPCHNNHFLYSTMINTLHAELDPIVQNIIADME